MSSDTTSTNWRTSLAELWADGIPLAGAMSVEILRLDERVLEIRAPLEPNRNHMGSAFGGSLQSLATLAGWGVVLIAAGPPGSHHVVIRDARMRFRVPVVGELVARAMLPSAGAVAAFRGTLAGQGQARLTVPVSIRGPGGAVAARFVGEFVALRGDAPQGASAPGPTPEG